MAKYIGKRILMMIPVLLGVILVVFIMNHISPGNPAELLAGEGATEEAVEALSIFGDEGDSLCWLARSLASREK